MGERGVDFLEERADREGTGLIYSIETDSFSICSHNFRITISQDLKLTSPCRQISELQTTIASSLSSLLLLHLYPRSLIALTLTILSSDGSLLSTLFNASTLALIDAGIPMTAPLWSCTSGSTSSYSAADEGADPLLDLNRLEEMELPFLTVGVAGGVEGVGGEDRVVVLVAETRVQGSRLEGMLAVGVDGCRRVGEILDGVVRAHGKRVLEGRASE